MKLVVNDYWLLMEEQLLTRKILKQYCQLLLINTH